MLSRVKVDFERVTESDLPQVRQMLASAPELSHLDVDQVLAQWLREGYFIKAVDSDNRVVGVLHARVVDDAVWMEGIAVSTDIRRKGVAKQLAVYTMNLTGGRVFRVMAHERNIPSNALALALGFKEIDRVYYCDGIKASAEELASKLSLRPDPQARPEGAGYVDSWVWRPMSSYKGRVFVGNGVVVLDTSPPFIVSGDADGYERFCRQPRAEAETFIVYELRRD